MGKVKDVLKKVHASCKNLEISSNEQLEEVKSLVTEDVVEDVNEEVVETVDETIDGAKTETSAKIDNPNEDTYVISRGKQLYNIQDSITGDIVKTDLSKSEAQDLLRELNNTFGVTFYGAWDTVPLIITADWFDSLEEAQEWYNTVTNYNTALEYVAKGGMDYVTAVTLESKNRGILDVTYFEQDDMFDERIKELRVSSLETSSITDRVQVGNEITVNTETDDPDLYTWLEEHLKASYKVTKVDKDENLVWIEDCPYAIWEDDIFKVYDNPIHLSADNSLDKEIGKIKSNLARLANKLEEAPDFKESKKIQDYYNTVMDTLHSLEELHTTLHSTDKKPEISAEEDTNPKVENMVPEAIENLVWIGFDKWSAYKPRVIRYVKQMMERATELGLAVPYNYGRGKGKYTLADGITDIDDVVVGMQQDSKAKDIARAYVKTQAKGKEQR